jgi:hypothetical protein
MPDLSDLLGDVYGKQGEDAPSASSTAPSPPEWSDDEHLDKAFSEWTPGPDADAPEAERNMFASPAPRLADDLAAALSEAVLAESAPEEEAAFAPAPEDEAAVAELSVVERPVAAEPAGLDQTAPMAAPAPAPRVEPSAPAVLADLEPVTEPVAVVAPAPVHKPGWQRSDDDILPTGRAARGVRLPKPRGKAPKSPKGPEAETGPKKERRGLKGLASMELSFGKKKK